MIIAQGKCVLRPQLPIGSVSISSSCHFPLLANFPIVRSSSIPELCPQLLSSSCLRWSLSAVFPYRSFGRCESERAYLLAFFICAFWPVRSGSWAHKLSFASSAGSSHLHLAQATLLSPHPLPLPCPHPSLSPLVSQSNQCPSLIPRLHLINPIACAYTESFLAFHRSASQTAPTDSSVSTTQPSASRLPCNVAPPLGLSLHRQSHRVIEELYVYFCHQTPSLGRRQEV
ncbi:hypothetical protein T440DRAFT_469811 [Plenodomus tracheiphilus IPT5]|uniref:Uncharacterized protein n=1 Tax=Plenodomus tracheiphilus IPT5 TaxID=1408161 RepID=A0A6A7AZR7_9PLEO|nr:hypothetical protein T440DRAFT_469811 [Plenodomus tracheiphilus IPT5]